ncbi:hypothetical protein [Endozoicomonas lisbonensis]|uniref:Membrane metal-binding protein n=1 Tax=Endozoicomonas lisbonensis TaxID=3120522 RepID=A0ABV2SCY7_9GAMM
MHTLAAGLSLKLAKKLKTTPLNAQILILFIMYLAVLGLNNDSRNMFGFFIFWGISSVVLLINVMINGKIWLEKQEDN